MASKSFYNFLCLLGIALSVYSLYVEYKIEEDPSYEPACNINLDIQNVFKMEANCADVLTSDYGRGMFGLVDKSRTDLFKFNPTLDKYANQAKTFIAELKNPVSGIFFYVVMMFLGSHWDCPQAASYSKWGAIVSCMVSAYLAYILTFIITDICVVCISIYICNIGLWYISYKREKSIGAEDQKKKN